MTCSSRVIILSLYRLGKVGAPSISYYTTVAKRFFFIWTIWISHVCKMHLSVMIAWTKTIEKKYLLCRPLFEVQSFSMSEPKKK